MNSPLTRQISTAARAKPRQRVLVCSLGIPHESIGASTVLYFHYIHRLHQAGFDIVHLMLLEGEQWPDSAVTEYAAKMTGPGEFRTVVARSKLFVTAGRWKHRLHHAAVAKALQETEEFRADVLVAFDIIPAWVTMSLPVAKRIVWLGDLYYQSIFWNQLYSIGENKRLAIHFPSNWLACQVWKRVYRRVLTNVDEIIVSSVSSRDRMKRLGLESTYEPYPWPMELAPTVERKPFSRPTFLFFGSLAGLGSRSALHFMVEKLYPLLCRQWGKEGFSILLAGRGGLPAWFKDLIAGKPEFNVLGYVEDLDAVMAQCHAVIVPISVPVGNRSRILTAMGKRTLVIAHKNAALGNPDLIDGETCYLAQSPNEFLEKMKRAVLNEEGSQRIIERAADCCARFRPDVAAAKLIARVQDTCTLDRAG